MKYEKEIENNKLNKSGEKSKQKNPQNGPSMRYKKISNYILSK